MTKLRLCILAAIPRSLGMIIPRTWTTKHWCESVIRPEWPFAYSKYSGQIEEAKGRVSTNAQDVRHECETRGVRSKCHVCEKIVCGEDNDKVCSFQFQGVSWHHMSVNIPTVSDVPWAINGSHRYDFGGQSTTHVCVYLSGDPPCQSSNGYNYSGCELRCWGYGNSLSGRNATSGTTMEGNLGGHGLNYQLEILQGVNSTQSDFASPAVSWEYPKFGVDNNEPKNPIPRSTYSFNPQGFVFTLAGSDSGEAGFLDGVETEARFRHPEGVAVDHDGYVYVCDTGNHAIRIISPMGRVQTIAGTGESGYRDGYVASDDVQFSSPTDIAVWRDWASWPYENPIDPDSFLYRNGNGKETLFVADTGNHRIRKITGDIVFDSSTGEKKWINVFVECFSGRCGSLSYNPEPGFADGIKERARFDSPRGITVSDDGKVIVADTNNHIVRELDIMGTVKTIAGLTMTLLESERNAQDCLGQCLPSASDSDYGHFSFPSDVALATDDSAIFVADRHHVRKVGLVDNKVETVAGGNMEGDRDGIGSESTLNNPSSLTVTADGVVYFVDSTSCRIRRLIASSTFIPLISCHDTLSSIMRPSGCWSYNVPSDEYGTTVSPVEGNIHYNYHYRNILDYDMGHEFVGRSSKKCVGSPPPVLLDKKSYDAKVSLYPFNSNLVIDDNNTRIREDPNDGTRITVSCRPDCYGFLFDGITETIEVPEIGFTRIYSEGAPVCEAAAKEGILSHNSGLIDVTIVSEAIVSRLKANTSLHGSHQYFYVSGSSREMKVQTIAGAPSSLRGESCGYLNSFPPHNGKFGHPAGIGAFVNSSLDDKESFVFIADRENNAIRGMSAVCTFRCENGGICAAPDHCECSEGWTAVDCTKPLCVEDCSSRELCVAPNTCACIPGFFGDDCLDATCVQKCENGGYCSAPDTCTCSPGWFDPNCTTPVCEQTCGNGGNCTSANTCSCPIDWGGFDCRVPSCLQNCSNGICVAPNTCLCPPSWSGYDCSMPVCHQGFFVPFYDLPGVDRSLAVASRWNEYRPCDYLKWCNETNGFGCAQSGMSYNESIPHYGHQWRYKTGRKSEPEYCMLMELRKDAITHFQYLSSWDNSSTSYFRYSPSLPYDWLSSNRLPWNAFVEPQAGITQPYIYEIDRQIALVSYGANVTQGAYMCANNGICVAPETCSCSKGWIGFDCRTPVCDKGYYEPKLNVLNGAKSDDDISKFKKFLDPRTALGLNYSDNSSSNRIIHIWTESFINSSSLERVLTVINGSRYLQQDGYQGGYECSIRSVTEWERAEHLCDHPNFYSKYMDEKVEGDGAVYSHWKEMRYTPTHYKTAKLVKHDYEYVSSNSSNERSFVYTDKGHMLGGVWRVTGSKWEKGICVVEFDRRCEGRSERVDPDYLTDHQHTKVFVLDSEVYRPRISYDDKRVYVSGRLFTSKNEVCIDRVVHGCFNNGTCVGPNTCECSPGWSGDDCSVPICEQSCLHHGNCTYPNTCTCERGWSGENCSAALCAQQCKNGGTCVAPDTCQCLQWKNTWRDGRVSGGVPIFKKPNGDPQMTGWTGYDCSTPICVQAERFRLNVDSMSSRSSDIVRLGGHINNSIQCNEEQCPEFDEMLTQNDGRSFQNGCGWDVLQTGCCFVSDLGLFTCFRCLNLEVGESNATCGHGSFRTWVFDHVSTVPLTFRNHDGITMCGPDVKPSNNEVEGSNLTSTSNMFLCNRFQWEQGDYIDNAGMGDLQGIGSDFGLREGRHIRINYNNYQRSQDNANKWVVGPQVVGEGIFECYNFGSCIRPDTCSCADGYGGFDCSTPLCRHQQFSGDIVGCQHGGICTSKDDCHCIQVVSVLWQVHAKAERGLTGWSGTDCSIPMCVQGYYDPECNAPEYAPGREGCYRCFNGGLCVSPDRCQCAEGWSGYDCHTPVCKAEVSELILSQLMTTDPNKIIIFENDPCGMTGFSSLRDNGPRGVCTMPNQCTCVCRGSFDDDLCRKLGGRFCQSAFHDPLFRSRNILAPDQVFGTRNCFSGFEGSVNGNDLFRSCHLTIYEPSFFTRYTVLLIIFMIVSALCICLLFGYIWIKLTRSEVEKRRKRQLDKSERNSKMHSFAYDTTTKKD